MHNWPGIPTGQFAIRPGAFFAAADQIDIVINGTGAHAAKPHEGVDPIVVASHIITSLQTIVSRNANPVEQKVVSITSIESSSKAYNVIPASVTLRGTVRTMSKESRDLAQKRIKEICEYTAQAFGAEAELIYHLGYPVMVNHDAQTEFAAKVASDVSGKCDEAPLIMAGEDFAFMLEERPGAYILVGNGDSAPVHHPEYNFDDDAIPAGCSMWAGLIETAMPID